MGVNKKIRYREKEGEEIRRHIQEGIRKGG
jgi:hypothetical protein